MKKGSVFTGNEENLFYYPSKGEDIYRLGIFSKEKIQKAVLSVFDFRPKAIIEQLELRSPIYILTTCYGHFGKDELPYERCDKTDELKEALNNV